jgi:hypothetical protein
MFVFQNVITLKIGLDIVKHKEPAYPPDHWHEDLEDYSNEKHNDGKRTTSSRKTSSATVVFPTVDSAGGEHFNFALIRTVVSHILTVVVRKVVLSSLEWFPISCP